MNIREIAKIANVSPTTVSLVLNNKSGVSKQTRQKVKDVLIEFNYKSNSTPNNNLKNICILKFSEHSGKTEDQNFVLSVIEEIYYLTYQKSIKTTMAICDEGSFIKTTQKVVADKYDAIIVIAFDMEISEAAIFKEIDFKGIPVVVVGSNVESSSLSSVEIANEEESYKAVKYLYNCGYRSIGYLHSSSKLWCFQQRSLGYFQAVKDLQLNSPIVITLESTINGAYKYMQEWLNNGFDIPRAFFADNDNTALGAMNALLEAGYRIPEDISIIAIDDIVYSAFSDCPLTTIHISRSQIARTVIEYLSGSVPELPVRFFCKGHLIIRDSTRKFNSQTETNLIHHKMDK